MRVLFFIFLVFTFSAEAQTPAIKQSFAEGTNAAQRGEFEKASEKFRRVLLSAETEKPNDEFLTKVHFNLGVCLYRLKKTRTSNRRIYRSDQTFAPRIQTGILRARNG